MDPHLPISQIQNLEDSATLPHTLPFHHCYCYNSLNQTPALGHVSKPTSQGHYHT